MNNETNSIKLIATDMDGTFLDDNKNFDNEFFQKIILKLKSKDIEFVIASGNQYQHLVDIFGDEDNNFSYIADNGAVVIYHGKVIEQKFINLLDLHKSLNLLKGHPKLQDGLIVLSGERTAYIEKNVPDYFIEEGEKYYRQLTRVDSFYDVQDKIYKIALAWPDQNVKEQESILKETLTDLHITSSGFGGVDIISQEVNKGKALIALQKYMKFHNSQIVVFGDSDNDLELLEYCQRSYAMKNANELIKKVANYHTKWDNNESGVLKTIDLLID